MTTVFARKALLADGWAQDVRLEVDAGQIVQIRTGVSAAHEDHLTELLIPGLCNAHSHAFQRALVGRTEKRSPSGRDNFWSWRESMYALAKRVDAQQLTAIATQAYVEMLAAGFTSVAEFHYLHGNPADDGDAMFAALQSAATASGIRLIYVPVLYERAGFDKAEPLPQQRRFAMSCDAFLEHQARCASSAAAHTSVAIGAHSLRAVSSDSLRAIADVVRAQQIPMHLHIAEQAAEIEQCVSASGKRPVEWLLENLAVNEQWCLVHATHMNAAEIEALAKTNAVVCICPSTEANLGDGIFPLPAFLTHGGRIAIGSDSQVSINPFEELRWLEYGQRLATLTRNVASLDHAHTGHELFQRTLSGGAQAGGLGAAGLQSGADADFLTLDADSPVLAAHDDDTLLDALIFSGHPLPIERVMVHGEWQVIDGQHVAQDAARQEFAAAVRALQ